jgi:hypothetical protein
MTGFEHPILFGIFCSIAVGNSAYIMRGKIVKGGLWTGFATFMTLMSLSSGALLSAVMQSGLIFWDWITKSKWKVLLVIVAIITVFLELASNRGPIIIFIETLTFNSGTAWTRVIQWEYGSAEVLRNPIFGKGLTGDWIRPSWLYTSSIDAYWLVIAFRHGLPGIFFLLGAFGFTVWRALKAENLSFEAHSMRTGYLITMAGIFFSLVTVHVWGGLSIFIYAYMGAGLWFLSDAAQSATTDAEEDLPAGPVSRFARSNKRHVRGGPEGMTSSTPDRPSSPAPMTRRTKYLEATQAHQSTRRQANADTGGTKDQSHKNQYTRFRTKPPS